MRENVEGTGISCLFHMSPSIEGNVKIISSLLTFTTNCPTFPIEGRQSNIMLLCYTYQLFLRLALKAQLAAKRPASSAESDYPIMTSCLPIEIVLFQDKGPSWANILSNS
jgi:hypothetical protein